jgi:hypothetical protein
MHVVVWRCAAWLLLTRSRMFDVSSTHTAATDVVRCAVHTQVRDVDTATDPARSSALLRRLVRSGLLRYTDMRDAPEKFFIAHRLLSTIGLGGFGIRFTVQCVHAIDAILVHSALGPRRRTAAVQSTLSFLAVLVHYPH